MLGVAHRPWLMARRTVHRNMQTRGTGFCCAYTSHAHTPRAHTHANVHDARRHLPFFVFWRPAADVYTHHTFEQISLPFFFGTQALYFFLYCIIYHAVYFDCATQSAIWLCLACSWYYPGRRPTRFAPPMWTMKSRSIAILGFTRAAMLSSPSLTPPRPSPCPDGIITVRNPSVNTTTSILGPGPRPPPPPTAAAPCSPPPPIPNCSSLE